LRPSLNDVEIDCARRANRLPAITSRAAPQRDSHEAEAALIPFPLEGVAARTELNQGDGIHPTAEGHRVIADSVWRVLAPVLRGL
jgi:lysophospholipase L1-like esterase